MHIQWHLRNDTQTCEWMFRLTEGTLQLTMSLPEFFNLVKALGQTCLQLGQTMVGDMSVADAIAEAERLVNARQSQAAKKSKSGEKGRLLLTTNGVLVGEVDRDYEIVDGRVVFEEVLLKGIWPASDNKIMFNGTVLKVESVASHTGLLIDEKGARGPVLKLVNCKVAE